MLVSGWTHKLRPPRKRKTQPEEKRKNRNGTQNGPPDRPPERTPDGLPNVPRIDPWRKGGGKKDLLGPRWTPLMVTRSGADLPYNPMEAPPDAPGDRLPDGLPDGLLNQKTPGWAPRGG